MIDWLTICARLTHSGHIVGGIRSPDQGTPVYTEKITPAPTTTTTGAHRLPRLETGNTSATNKQPPKLLDDPEQLFTPPPRPLWPSRYKFAQSVALCIQAPVLRERDA